MNWAEDYRHNWIAETLRVFSFIQRKHLCRKFRISAQQAAIDFRHFQTAHPDAMRYDKTAKRYVAVQPL